MFSDLLKIVVDGGYAVRAYEDCARRARSRIPSEPQNAAALLLISYAAQRFVDAYDDQPLPVDEANDELTRFSSMLGTLDESLASGDPEKELSGLNSVAARIFEAVNA
ncbi:MAG: hypothetical protein CL535_18095 [Ahrensia sp.]|nr:hypothetical protein [Ahrensia sp.]